MENKKYSLWSIFAFGIFCLFMGFSACSEEEPGEEFTAPSISNNGATNVERTRITLSGTFKGNLGKVATYGVKYSESSNFPPDKTTIVTLSDAIQASCTTTLTGLSPNTHYYYCWFASTGVSESTSTPGEFTTTSTSMPMFGEVVVDSIGENMMRLSCTVDEIGDNFLIEYGFSYKLTTDKAYIPVSATKLDDEATHKFTVELTGLKAATTYQVRAYAKNSGTEDASDGVKEGYSEMQELKTGNQLSPEVTTKDVINIGINTATAVGEVTAAIGSNGVITERGFCYSTENLNPTIYDSVKKADGTALKQNYQAQLSGLISMTTYYVRAYAKNIVNGQERVGYGETIEITTEPFMEPEVQIGYENQAGDIQKYVESTATTAKVYAFLKNYDAGALKERGFVWSKDDQNVTIEKAGTNIVKEVKGDKTFIGTISGLTRNTHYYVRAYAIYEVEGQDPAVGYSYAHGFSTSDIESTYFKDLTFGDYFEFASVEVSSGISQLGDGTLIERGFCWKKADGNWDVSLEENKYTGYKKVEDGTDDNYSLNISGLIPNQEYYIRAYAKMQFENQVFISYSNTSGSAAANFSINNFPTVEATATTCTFSVVMDTDISGMEEYGVCLRIDGTEDNILVKCTNWDATTKTFSGVAESLKEGTRYSITAYVKTQGVTVMGNYWRGFETKRIPTIDSNVSPGKND